MDHVQKIGVKLKALVERIGELCEGKANKGDLKALLSQAQMVQQDLLANLPFAERQFMEDVGKTVTEAKGALDAMLLRKILSLGMEGLTSELLLQTLRNDRPKALPPSEHVSADDSLVTWNINGEDCPKCKGNVLQANALNERVGWYPLDRYRCKDCGHEWTGK